MSQGKRTQLIASRLPGFFKDEPSAIYFSYEQTPSKLKEAGLRCLDDFFDGPQLKNELYRVHEICGPCYLLTTEWLHQNFEEEFGLNWTLSQTRSLFNAWFHSFITSAYDMQVRIEALSEDPDGYYALALSEESFCTPNSAVELKGLCSSELGRHQLFSILASGRENIALEFQKSDFNQASLPIYTVQRSKDLTLARSGLMQKLKEKKWPDIREAIKRRLARLLGNVFEPVAFFIDIHLPARLENNFLLLSFGRIRLLSPNFRMKTSEEKSDSTLRARLCRARGENKFACEVMKAFQYFLPKSCAEGFRENYGAAERSISKKGKMHFSYAHQSDEKYAFFSNALRQFANHKLCSTMHAGPYFLANLWQLPLSLGSDAIVGFGGEERLFSNSHKIGGAYKTDFERSKKFSSEDIVYFSTIMPQGSIDGSFSSVQMDRYFRAQKEFFTALSPFLRQKILFRPFKQDYGRDYFNKLKPYLEGIRVDDLSLTGIERIQRSKIVVCDNINTVYYEVIKLGVPAIFVIDQDLFLELDAYLDLYEEMRKSKILWHDLDKAIFFLESIAADPAEWWESPDVAKTRKMFLDYLDPFSTAEFTKNLLSFVNNSELKIDFSN